MDFLKHLLGYAKSPEELLAIEASLQSYKEEEEKRLRSTASRTHNKGGANSPQKLAAVRQQLHNLLGSRIRNQGGAKSLEELLAITELCQHVVVSKTKNQGGAKSPEELAAARNQCVGFLGTNILNKRAVIAAAKLQNNKGLTRKNRRKSINGSVLSKMAMEAVGCVPEGTKIENNFRLIKDIMTSFDLLNNEIRVILKENINSTTTFLSKAYFLGRGSSVEKQFSCIAIFAFFSLKNGAGHFVPYICINGRWYIADDEKGILILRTNGIISGNTKYIQPDGVVDKSSQIYQVILIYCISTAIPVEQSKKTDYSGDAIFGQSGLTCGPDSIQSILMFADGLRDIFMHMYNNIQQSIDVKKFYILANKQPNKTNINSQIDIIQKPIEFLMRVKNPTVLRYICIMFIRFYRISNTPQEELNSILKYQNDQP